MELVKNMFPDNILKDILERRHYIANRLTYIKYNIDNLSETEDNKELFNELSSELILLDKILSYLKA